jgi:phasin
MSTNETGPFAVPPDMRSLAETSVEQAKSAFNAFINATHEAVNSLEGRAEASRMGAKDVTEKAMAYAERNVSSAFEFAQKLVRANSMQDFVRLQGEFIQAQMQALQEQAKDLADQAKEAQSRGVPPG